MILTYIYSLIESSSSLKAMYFYIDLSFIIKTWITNAIKDVQPNAKRRSHSPCCQV